MKLIFAGTPEPAVPALKALIASSHEVVAVITRPDARKGRGRTLYPSPIKEVALENGIEVLTPSTLKADTEDGQAVRERIKELAPDAIPVVAYGNLVPEDLLDAATHGWVNLHFSLLPAWRGAAPVQASIRAGDDITGASTFQIEQGLDTGPVLGTITETSQTKDTAGELLERLSQSGAHLLVATMDGLESGEMVPQPQQGEPTYASKITTEDARIRWSEPDFAVDRHVRAHTPAPGAWTMLGDDRMKIGKITPLHTEAEVLNEIPELSPGQVHITKKAVYVGTATTPVRVDQLQPVGKKMMNAADWGRGLGANNDVEVNFS
ncbi:methionyl-tRNA formyltransferase [Corynebacterium sp. L4756]|uniref:methionyl-tRNA formyltransferase n=1 Tax=unclassified Corynebacterium TaxID=2624378 RepID=UPI00374D5572